MKESRYSCSIPFKSLIIEDAARDAITDISVFQKNSENRLNSLISEHQKEKKSAIKDEEQPNYTIPNSLVNTENLILFLEKITAPLRIPIPLRLIPNAVDFVSKSEQCDFGTRLLFSTCIKSIPLMSDFISSVTCQKETRKSIAFAQKAISMINDVKLPPLFYPDFSEKTTLNVTMDQIKPVLPTAIAASQNSIFVGIKGSGIYEFMIHGENCLLTKKHEIPFIGNENYSLIYSNQSLFICTEKGRVLCHDQSTFEIGVSFRGHFFSQLNTFTAPVVTDGKMLYSVSFGSSPCIKIFEFSMDSILFVRVVPLEKSSSILQDPFKELLPAKFKEIAPIATNGVYLSVILRSGLVSICRIFSVRTGKHLHDVVLDPSINIISWSFDAARPGHLLLVDNDFVFLKTRFTIPLWQVGFKEPTGKNKIKTEDTKGILTCFYESLSILASQCIGASTDISFSICDDNLSSSIEAAFCSAIENRYLFGAQAMLVFLDMKLMQNQKLNSSFLHVLNSFDTIMKTEEFKDLRSLVVRVLLSNLDIFCKSSAELTSSVLLTIICADKYQKELFAFLPKSKYLTSALSNDSLKKLCEISLKTSFIYDELSISLLCEIQYWLCMAREKRKDMFLIYLRQLNEQFLCDFVQYQNGHWGGQRFVDSVSYNVLSNLVCIVNASEPFSIFTFGAVSILFSLGCKLVPEELELASNVSELLNRCLFLSLKFGFKIVGENESFTYISTKEADIKYPQEEFESFVDSTGITELGIDHDFYQAVMEIAFLSNRDNMQLQTIRETIANVFKEVVYERKKKEVIMERIKRMRAIMPQVFRNVFEYLTGNSNDLKVATKNHDSSTVKFLALLDEKTTSFTAARRAILSVFLPQLRELNPYLAILNVSFLFEFVSSFPLKFFLHHELVKMSGFKYSAKSIIKLNEGELFECFDNILCLCDKIDEKELLVDQLRRIREMNITDKANEKTVQRALMLARLGLTGGCFDGIDIESFNDISKRCLTTGNYTIISHVLALVELIIKQKTFDVNDFLLFAFKSIGRFLSKKENYFSGQTNQFTCAQCVMLVAEFFRKNLQNNLGGLIFLKESIEQHELDDSLSIFAIMNNSVDIIRPGARVSFYDCDNSFYDDIVTFYGTNSSNMNIKNSIHEFRVTDLHDLCAFSTVKFDHSVIEDVYSKMDLFEYFNNASPFYNVFMLASFSELMKLESFSKFCSKEFIEKIISKNKTAATKPEQFLFRFTQVFATYFDIIPQFSFESNQSVSKGSNKKQTNDESSQNSVISLEKPMTFFSSPLHTRVPFHLVMNSKARDSSAAALEIQMIGVEYDLSFITKKIEFSNAEITICPEQNLIFLKTGSEEHSFSIQPCCEMVFVSLYLQPNSVVNYSFDPYDEYKEETHSAPEAMMINDSFSQEFPHILSEEFFEKQLQEICSPISSHFALMSYLRYWKFNTFDEDPSTIASLLMRILAVIDSDPLSSLMTIESLDASNVFMDSGKELIEFVLNVTNKLTEDKEKSTKVFDELINIINSEIDSYSKNFVSKESTAAATFDAQLPQKLPRSFVIAGDEIFAVNGKTAHLKNQTKSIVVMRSDISGTVLQLVVDIRHLFAIILHIAKNRDVLFAFFTNAQEITKKAASELKLKQINAIYEYSTTAFPYSYKEPTSSDKWCQKMFPSFFENDPVFTGTDPRQFFFFNDPLKTFPVTNFVLRILESSSFASSTVAMSQKMVSFQNTPSSNDEYIFLVIRVDKKIPVVFELSNDREFTKTTEVYPNKCCIIPPDSFFIRPKSNFDMKLAQFFWKTFVLPKEQIDKYLEEAGRWTTEDSRQLVMMANRGEQLSEERFSVMPLSTKFSFAIAAFYWSIIDECSHIECCDSIKKHIDPPPVRTYREITFRNISADSSSYELFEILVERMSPVVINALAEMTGAEGEICAIHLDGPNIIIGNGTGLIGIGEFDELQQMAAKLMKHVSAYMQPKK